MAAIYDEQVRTSLATFDTEERGAAYLGEKLAHAGGGDVVLVATSGGEVLGYAYTVRSGRDRPTPPPRRCRSTSHRRRAAAASPPGCMPRCSPGWTSCAEVHTQVAVIALPNAASEALHLAHGFELVGVLREVGHKFGQFVDTAWYQRLR